MDLLCLLAITGGLACLYYRPARRAASATRAWYPWASLLLWVVVYGAVASRLYQGFGAPAAPEPPFPSDADFPNASAPRRAPRRREHHRDPAVARFRVAVRLGWRAPQRRRAGGGNWQRVSPIGLNRAVDRASRTAVAVVLEGGDHHQRASEAELNRLADLLTPPPTGLAQDLESALRFLYAELRRLLARCKVFLPQAPAVGSPPPPVAATPDSQRFLPLMRQLRLSLPEYRPHRWPGEAEGLAAFHRQRGVELLVLSRVGRPFRKEETEIWGYPSGGGWSGLLLGELRELEDSAVEELEAILAASGRDLAQFRSEDWPVVERYGLRPRFLADLADAELAVYRYHRLQQWAEGRCPREAPYWAGRLTAEAAARDAWYRLGSLRQAWEDLHRNGKSRA